MVVDSRALMGAASLHNPMRCSLETCMVLPTGELKAEPQPYELPKAKSMEKLFPTNTSTETRNDRMISAPAGTGATLQGTIPTSTDV